MKKIIFYICTFVLVTFTVGSKIGSKDENYTTCLTENNVSEDDMFTAEDITLDRHKSEDQEKIKKNGCVFQCLTQKKGAMQDAEYNIEVMHSFITKITNARPGGLLFEAFDNCINETKDLPEKCEKSFALTECMLKAQERMLLMFYGSPTSNHEEHEHKHETHEHEHELNKSEK
ncbi:PREDICTED: pheromone-binding protein Gp-9-like [Wasmannia auropunctata]|uniref:pheromone-binding protein Gp-9-like n=1 Tax=Wasmannia auropunctata TaxID=64793 RepID=UPI0005ED9A07|nr:PREDICTED: pheromone-binding protein Gp-9-like [Wasmannia auropunctata]